MKTIVYGIGKEYSNFFGNISLVSKMIKGTGFEVIGFSDGKKEIWGKEVVYNGKKFIIHDIREFQSEYVDYIIITTQKYFDEIRMELLTKGYIKDQILSIEKIYKSYVEQILSVKELGGKVGIEVGGPTQLFGEIYERCMSCDNVNFSLNTVWGEHQSNEFLFRDRCLGKQLIMDATDMSGIEDKKYDFVLSSNNLEHIANPLKAMKEFSRIVKRGGIIEVIVPRKEDTFDHDREYTSFEHLCEDYINDVGEDDLTHMSEIIEKHDYNMDVECGGKRMFIERAKKNYENRCLHHHVFEKECLKKIFEFAGLEIRRVGSILGNWCITGVKRQ